MVDELRVYPNAWGPFLRGSCHLSTDGDLEELHALARRIGLRRSWFQDHRFLPHYDLTASKREAALRAGAVFVPARKQAQRRREAREAYPRDENAVAGRVGAGNGIPGAGARGTRG